MLQIITVRKQDVREKEGNVCVYVCGQVFGPTKEYI